MSASRLRFVAVFGATLTAFLAIGAVLPILPRYFSESFAIAMGGGLLMGAGFSLLYPALALLVVEQVDERRRGAAMGTFTAFFDAGVGIGGPVVGLVVGVAGYPAGFWPAAGCALVAASLAAFTTAPPRRISASA